MRGEVSLAVKKGWQIASSAALRSAVAFQRTNRAINSRNIGKNGSFHPPAEDSSEIS